MLYHYRPEGRYIEALDPVFFYRFDRRLFNESVAILEGTAPDPYALLRKEFGARWLYLSRSSVAPRLLRQVLEDPRFVEVYQDENAVIYRLS